MKIGVIGAGSVGVGVRNYLLTRGSVRELVLFNSTLSRAEREALDFSHTNVLNFSKTQNRLLLTNKKIWLMRILLPSPLVHKLK